MLINQGENVIEHRTPALIDGHEAIRLMIHIADLGIIELVTT